MNLVPAMTLFFDVVGIWNQKPMRSISEKRWTMKALRRGNRHLEIRNRYLLDSLRCQDHLGLPFKRKTNDRC